MKIETEETKKDILWKKISDWRIEYSKYDVISYKYSKSLIYWTFGDLCRILEESNVSDKTVEMCADIFNRFKNYY